VGLKHRLLWAPGTQVVAVLNPIAGGRMQEDLEDRISSLQQELDKAHSQV
jgi:hypothetical protein